MTRARFQGWRGWRDYLCNTLAPVLHARGYYYAPMALHAVAHREYRDAWLYATGRRP